MNELVTIRFSRRVGDRLVDYKLVLDAVTREEVYLGPDMQALAGALQSEEFTVNEVGAKVQQLPGGGVKVIGLTEWGRTVMDFFNVEVDFDPRGAELRRRYFEELDQLNDDPDCTDCARSRLMQRYARELRAIMP